MAEYDSEIRAHYAKVAQADGLSPTSTMADERTRKLETDAIIAFVRLAIGQGSKAGTATRIADFGCGNGYTLAVLADAFPGAQLKGYEYTPELRALAEKRAKDISKLSIHPGDIRRADFAEPASVDVGIVQRVVINLLDQEDQRRAVANLVSSIKPGGHILFIEGFQSGLASLNAARGEFQLSAIPPAIHNLLLPDDFFAQEPRLRAMTAAAGVIEPNFLSTHYFVTRVLHELALDGRPFVRNSLFVQFMSSALAQNIGDFSPVRAYAFQVSG